MAGQGRHITSESIQRVIHFLAATDMTVSEIAERMAISRSTVVAINRRFQVRKYNGLRTRWLQDSAATAEQPKKKSP